MKKTLDEFFDSHEATKLLRENLKINLDVLLDIERQDKETLLRMHLTMVRQCLQDFGVE